MARADETLLDLEVGPFALALPARTVLTVEQGVRVAASVDVRGAQVPMCDLGAVFGGSPRAEVPFLVVLEAGGLPGAVGVDHVGHLRHREAPTLRPIPAFGLLAPELFAGGVRDGDRLLLVLDPASLAALTHDRARSI